MSGGPTVVPASSVEAGGTGAVAAGTGGQRLAAVERVEVVLDDAQRQVLVALGGQDVAQPARRRRAENFRYPDGVRCGCTRSSDSR